MIANNGGGKPLAIDLFCGLGGWAEGFLAEGYDVIGVDNDPQFAEGYEALGGHFILADVRDIDGRDFRAARCIVASPPCQGFSVARIAQNWTRENQPRTRTAVEAVELVKAAVRFIEEAQPWRWVMENPVGKLRALGIVPGVHKMITQCQYGAKWKKPTDLWGTFDFGTYLKDPCGNGSPCHEPAPRGAKTGVQGTRDPALRAKIPLPLARAVARGFL